LEVTGGQAIGPPHAVNPSVRKVAVRPAALAIHTGARLPRKVEPFVQENRRSALHRDDYVINNAEVDTTNLCWNEEWLVA
jgi:hypothetical protein